MYKPCVLCFVTATCLHQLHTDMTYLLYVPMQCKPFGLFQSDVSLCLLGSSSGHTTSFMPKSVLMLILVFA